MKESDIEIAIKFLGIVALAGLVMILFNVLR